MKKKKKKNLDPLTAPSDKTIVDPLIIYVTIYLWLVQD